MKYRFFLFLFFIQLTAYSQHIIRGRVTEAEGKKPLAGVSVFISNTSIGTTTNDDGQFQLNVSSSKFDLVVTSIGYQSWSETINTAELNSEIQVSLKLKAKVLDDVVIQAFEKNGWSKWGLFFIRNFIGVTDQAQKCKLKNHEVLRFRKTSNPNTLEVIAMEPLIIENKALGYKLRYQLEDFVFDFNTNSLQITGFPFFEVMDGKKSDSIKWAKERREVYEGSILHFMRSVYRNKLGEEGFIVQRLRKYPNVEKERVKKIVIEQYKSQGGIYVQLTKDSSHYYNRIMNEDDFRIEIGKEKLPGDSIAFAVNNTTAGLHFEDFLMIWYNKKGAPKSYTEKFPKSGGRMTSELTLIEGNEIEIQSNGFFYNPLHLFVLGYWAWSEKISTMLPFDYKY